MELSTNVTQSTESKKNKKTKKSKNNSPKDENLEIKEENIEQSSEIIEEKLDIEKEENKSSDKEISENEDNKKNVIEESEELAEEENIIIPKKNVSKFFDKISDETFLSKIENSQSTFVELIDILKNIELSPELLKKVNKKMKPLLKNIDTFHAVLMDNIEKSYTTASKGLKKKKKVVHDDDDDEENEEGDGSPKKLSPVETPKETLDFVKKFMNKGPDELVSRANVLQAISSYVKTERLNKNKEIEVWITEKEDKTDKPKGKVKKGEKKLPVKMIQLDEPEITKKKFKIIGDLIPLFDGIKNEMKNRNIDMPIPNELGYTDIMRYLSFCFPPKA